MFKIKLNIDNPFSKEDFKNLFSRSFQVYKNKFFEFEIVYYSNTLLDFNFSWTSRVDHAGLDLTLGLLFYSVSFRMYDRRHWNHKENRWENDN